MKRTHKKLADSDDDTDNVPLKCISSVNKEIISMKELKTSSIHACEFCEESFKNRYNYLIHNAKHIIIPLIKMLPHHCDICDLYCISEEEMNNHILVKHMNFVQPRSPSSNDCNIEISDRHAFVTEDIHDELNEDEKPLNCLIMNENKNNMNQSNISENILQNFMMNCKVDLVKFVPPWHDSDKDDHESNNIIEICESNFKNGAIGNSITLSNMSKTDEIIFEKKNNILENQSSEEENNGLKTDPDKYMNPEAFSELSPELSDSDDDSKSLLTPVKQETGTEYHNNEYNSIHFDDLTKPGIFYCKLCFKKFPNRFQVIVHEVVHLDLSKAVTKKVKHKIDSVITIPLAQRASRKHVKNVTKCDHCNKKITNKDLHAKICFGLFCSGCGKGFHRRSTLTAHEDGCNGEAVINLCDLCLYVRKRPEHVQYFGIVRLTKLDVKRECHWCGKQCEDVSVVTLKSNQRLADRIQFEGDAGQYEARVRKLRKIKQANEQVKRRGARVSKTLSNRERLKLIQNRLKLMKK